MPITSKPPRTIKPLTPTPKAEKKGSIAAKNITKEVAKDAVATSQIRLKKREKFCANPECGRPFIPVNVRQIKCKECIKIANEAAQKATKDKILQKQETERKEKERKEAEIYQAAKQAAIEAAKQSAILPIPEEESTTLHDNLKLVNVRCRLEKDFPGECPHGGVFQCTWGKYQQGQAYCDRECHKLHKRLKSKAYQEEQEAKRQGRVPIEEVRLDYLPHDGQKLFHASPARFKVLICGARWGKDRGSMAEYILRFASMLSENRPSTLVPRVHGFIVAPTYPLANQIWRELKHFFPEQWIVNKNEAEHRMETAAGGIIEVKSADNPDSLVSVGLDIVLVTEAARVKDLEYTWSYLRGRLASPGRGPGGKGGIALLNSTPKGRTFLYQMYMWGQDVNYPDWASWQFPTVSNPYVNPKEVDDAEKTLPRNMFRQEFLGEFLEDSGEVFANVDDISSGVLQEPEIGRTYKAAWDPAQRFDYSGFGIRDDRGVQVVKERWTGVPWTIQLDRVEAYCKKYNNAHLDMDSTGIGETLPEAVAQRGVSVTGHFFTNAFKEQLVSHLALLCEGKDVVLLDDKDQKEEMKAYTYTFTKTGKVSYHHPVGGHDDLVTVLMLLYMDFNAAVTTLPFMGLLLGARRGANMERPQIHNGSHNESREPKREPKSQLPQPTGDMFRDMCIHQEYVPATCILPGQIAWGLVNKGEDPCTGCNGDRSVCKGRPRNPDLYKVG